MTATAIGDTINDERSIVFFRMLVPVAKMRNLRAIHAMNKKLTVRHQGSNSLFHLFSG